MKRFAFLTIILLVFCGTIHAQTLKGTVTEAGGARMDNVFVRDLANKQMTLTDKDGNFTITTAVGHSLVFASPGYTTDTLYLIDLSPKKIKMTMQTIALREVGVRSTRTRFNPRAEYPEVYEHAKLYVLSPTTWFSKSAKDARRLKKYFATEAQQRHVDEVFNSTYVSSLVPLRGRELEDFMTLYRPSYQFIRSNTAQSLAVYINDSYKKFQALPPEKRHIQSLADTVGH